MMNEAMRMASYDLITHIQRAKEFSEVTWGPGKRTKGVLNHIRKELLEIEAKPEDLTEWIDLIILAIDGAWRQGFSPEEIAIALEAKQTRNELRKWPNWREMSEDEAIEHDRSGEEK